MKEEKKALMIPVLLLVFVIVIGYLLVSNIGNQLSEASLKDIDPMSGVKAIGFVVGCVIVGAFIYSFWWYPKKCIGEFERVESENEKYYERMKNL